MKTAFLSALCGALCWCAMSTTATAHPLHANLDDAPRSVAGHSSSATFVLNNVTNATTGNAYSTIQEAIDAASAGDVILLAAGTFSPTGQITVNKALSLTGAGSGSTTIHAGGTGYGMSISADDVHLEGFTLDGAATFGVKASGVSNFSLQDVAAINGNNSAIDLNGVNGATLTDISASNTALGYGLAIASSSDVTVNGITTSSNAFGAIGIFPAQTQYQASGLEAPSNISIGGSVSLNGGAGAVTVQNGALASGGIWVGTVSNDAADNADVTVPAGFTHAVFSTRNDGLTGQSIASQAVIAGLVAYGAANPIPGVTYEDVYVYDMVEGDYEVFAPLLIQDALDAASAGDAITVADGTYAVETPILVNKAVTLQGQSEAGVLLECGAGLGGANSIQVTAGATLKDFTLNANSFATFGIHVQPGTANATLSGLTITNTASNGIGLSGVTDATVSDIAGSGNVQYVLGIAGSVGVTASDISGGNVGVYKGTGTYAQSATDIAFTGTFDLAGGFVIEQLAGADEITYSIDGSAADVTLPASFDRAFFANYADLPLPPPYNVASLATLVEADNLATVIGTALATEQLGFFTLNDVAVYNLTAAQWEVSAGLSIQDAIDRAAAGDVIDIAAGTYAEALSLSQGVTLNGNGSTLDVSGLGVGISIASDVDGVTIDNLTIVGDASTYSGITVNPGASNVSLLNNNISGMALSNPGNSSPLSYGILCWGNADPINPPSNILIDGNEIHGVSGTAISLGDNTEGVSISNNHFHDIAQVLVNGAPWSSGVVAGQANNLAISGNNMEGLAYASALTACTGVTLDANQYSGGTATMLLASLPNSILPDATDWWSLEAAAIGYIYYFNSAAAQAAMDAGLQAAGIPTTLSSSNPGCMESTACNYDSTALSEDNSCTYPVHPDFDCDGNCNNDADGDGICDELEGLLPELETACGHGTLWDATLGQCIVDVSCIGDIDFDGAVTSTDLLYVLGNFGSFCPGYGPDAGE